MKNLIITAVLFSLFSLPSVAAPMGNLDIVAVVGDDVISTLDVQERMNLAITSSGMPSTREVKERLFPQILRTLIDERLYLKEGKNLGIKATDEDIRSAMMRLEVQNHLRPGSFKSFLAEKGIPVDAAMEQLEAQVIWNKIITQRIRPRVIITERELEEKMEHISHSAGISEIDISEIVLPYEGKEDAQRVKALADKLAKEIRDGSDFSLVAKEFSQSTSAAAGGKLGWMQEEHAPKDLLPKVRNLQVGEISDPFMTPDSYTIVKLNDRRALVTEKDAEGKLSIKQMLVPVKKGTPVSAIRKTASTLEKESKKVSCDDFSYFAMKHHSAVSSETIEVTLSALNAEIRAAIDKTAEGKISPAILGPNGLYLFAVCKKPEENRAVVLKAKLQEMLMRNKLDLQAQRYLRNLRSKAFIDIRI